MQTLRAGCSKAKPKISTHRRPPSWGTGRTKFNQLGMVTTALFGMQHLTYGTNFLNLFAFLVSRPPQSALLHHQAPTLLLNRWLACLTGSSILVLKLTFSPDPFPRNLPLSLNGLISRFLSHTRTEVSGVENIGQCGRLI